MDSNNPKKIVEHFLGGKAVALFTALLKQRPQSADAIIFLQGDRLDRVPTVKSLYEGGLAKYIVISGNNKLIGRGKRNEENDIHLLKIKEYLVSHGIPEKAIIIDNQSLNTLEQAVNILKLAKKRGWTTLLIVTSPYHVLRSYLTFVKQVIKQGWQGIVIMQAADLSWTVVPSGRRKTAIEILALEMEKIQKYKSDLATVEEGIRYLQSKNRKN